MRYYVVIAFTLLLGSEVLAVADDIRCTEALTTAERAMASKQEQSSGKSNANSNQGGTSTASSGGAGDGIAGAIQQMAQVKQQQAELASQRLEKLQQIDDQKFAEITKIEDKQHELKKSFFKRKREAIDIEYEMRKEERAVESTCETQADTLYDALVAKLNGQSVQEKFVTNKLTGVKGVRRRVKAQKRIYYSRCMAKQSTKNRLLDIRGRRDAKMQALQSAAEEVESDLTYQRSKIPKLLENFDRKERMIAQQTKLQEDALAQQQQMAMIGALVGALSGASAGKKEAGRLGTFTKADQVVKDFHNIVEVCKNQPSGNYDLPVDFYPYFSDVRKYCRDDCIRSSTQRSLDNTNQNTQGSLWDFDPEKNRCT